MVMCCDVMFMVYGGGGDDNDGELGQSVTHPTAALLGMRYSH